MENRRAFYRHPFVADERIRVELLTFLQTPGTPFGGDILDLSVGGMGVETPRTEARAAPDDRVRAHFTAPLTWQPFDFECAIVHRHDRGNVTRYGVRFLPLADAAAEQARDKTLWGYLLEEQRRTIRARRRRD